MDTRAAVHNAESINLAFDYMLDDIDTDIYNTKDMTLNITNDIISLQYDKDGINFELCESLNIW